MSDRVIGTILLLKDSKVLGIAAYKHSGKFTLPGGRLKKGESIKAAAIRETSEETGLIVSKCHFLAAFRHENVFIHTYLADDWHGKLRSSEEGNAEWVKPQELVDHSVYSKVAKRILRLAGVI